MSGNHVEVDDMTPSSSVPSPSSPFLSALYSARSVLRASLHVRKVSTDSASRHFVQGGSEICELSFQECKLLILRKEDQHDKSEEYRLHHAEIVVHHYARDTNSLVIRFHSNHIEITLTFDDVKEMKKWKGGFDYALELYREKMDQIVPRTLHLVSEHLLRHHDPTSSLKMVDTTSLPRFDGNLKKHEINVETKFIGSVIEWRVRKLVNFENIFTTVDNSYFKPPSGDEIEDAYCQLNKPPYSSMLEPSYLALIPSTRAVNEDASNGEDADIILISNQSSNSSDDYIIVDEIDDKVSYVHGELPPHPNRTLTPTSESTTSSSLSRSDISFDSTLELFQSTGHTKTRPKPPYALSSLCHVNVNIDVNIPRTHHTIGAQHSNVCIYNSCLHDASLRKTLPTLLSIPMPRLNIVIMAVGTRGDIQPFILLGKSLRDDGHRVRLATHECFRSLVTSPKVGLEFYPLGGDPVKLSEYMVKSQGWLLPANAELIMETPAYLTMLSDVLFSTWGACTAEDPSQYTPSSDRDENGNINCKDGSNALPPFKASAIISNPVTYGHIHCAEALGIPLHLMFPQPWVPTKAFPHPLSFFDANSGWGNKNLLSYEMIDRLLWISMEQEVNRFRRDILGLQPIWMTLAQGGFNLLEVCKVPFANMFSPSLVPKPKDWAQHIDIVGSLCDVSEERNVASKLGGGIFEDVREVDGFSPPAELVAFLEGRPIGTSVNDFDSSSRGKPVFLGFGSMVIENHEVHRLVKMVLRSAAMAGVRILVQSGWGNLISMETFRDYANQAAEYAKVCSDSMDEENDIFFQEDEDIRDFDPLRPTGCSEFSKRRQEPPRSSFDKANKSRSSTPMWQFMFGNDTPKHKLPGGWMADADALLLGPCPHSWLFPRVAGVVHHGGAGTTAAGLRAGKPTMICPFFGDQHFWGDRVYQAGLGPKPCPASKLTETLLAESLGMLLAQGPQNIAAETSKILERENGVANAVAAFYKQLPISSMVCEISLFLGEIRLADVYCKDCGFNMNIEVCEMLHWGGRGYEVHDPFQCRPCMPAKEYLGEQIPDEKFETHCFQELQYIDWTRRRLQPTSEIWHDDEDSDDLVIKDTTFNIIHSSKKTVGVQGTKSEEKKVNMFAKGLDVVAEVVKGAIHVNNKAALESMVNEGRNNSRLNHLTACIDEEADAASKNEGDEDEDKLIFPAFSPQKTRSRKESNFNYIKSLFYRDGQVVDRDQGGEYYRESKVEAKKYKGADPAQEKPLSRKVVSKLPSIGINRMQCDVSTKGKSTEESTRITTGEEESQTESFEERREDILNAFYMARRVQRILIHLNKTLSTTQGKKSGVFDHQHRSAFSNHRSKCDDDSYESFLNFSTLVNIIETVCGDGGCESVSNSRAVATRVVEVLRNKNTHTVDKKGLNFLEFSLLLISENEGSIVWKGWNRHDCRISNSVYDHNKNRSGVR